MTGKSRARANGEGSIYERTGGMGWAGYVWVEKPDGTRGRKYFYGKTREEVYAKLVKLQNEAAKSPVATTSVKVGQYLTGWLADVGKPNVAPLTYATYETFVRVHIIPALGEKRLEKLRTREVQTWLNKLPSTCQCCAQGKDARRPPRAPEGQRQPRSPQKCCAIGECCEEYLSGRTIRDIRACLRVALNHAQRVEGIVDRNAAVGVRLPKARRKKRKLWDTDEARRFLESARNDRDPLFAAYVLVVVNALRKGEALGAVWEAIDLDEAELSTEWQLQRVGRRLLHRETKTEASDDTLPLPDISVAALRQRLTDQDAAREKAGDAWQEASDEGRLVFTSPVGSPIEPRTFNRAWDARCAKAGVRKINIHDARRTCATLLVDLDVHPRVLMQILRHAEMDVSMEIYAQASTKQTREALRKLGTSLASQPSDESTNEEEEANG